MGGWGESCCLSERTRLVAQPQTIGGDRDDAWSALVGTTVAEHVHHTFESCQVRTVREIKGMHGRRRLQLCMGKAVRELIRGHGS